jgi:predicted membrane GTPase involved in stress response
MWDYWWRRQVLGGECFTFWFEGYELAVFKPEVIFRKDVKENKIEPIEEVVLVEYGSKKGAE